MQRGELILPTGQRLIVTPGDRRKFTLRELQNFVGGNLELLKTKTGRGFVYVNEDGRSKRLAPNHKGTEVVRDIYGPVVILGPVLIVTGNSKFVEREKVAE